MDITIQKVDIGLLRHQRDALIEIQDRTKIIFDIGILEGTIKLLDSILAIANSTKEQLK